MRAFKREGGFLLSFTFLVTLALRKIFKIIDIFLTSVQTIHKIKKRGILMARDKSKAKENRKNNRIDERVKALLSQRGDIVMEDYIGSSQYLIDKEIFRGYFYLQ
jgi:hypothetical protein